MKLIKTAVGGSAADPPHLGHLAVLRKLYKSALFDRIIWIISGNRKDKQFDVCPNDRIAMTELMIPRAWRESNQPDLVLMYDDVYGTNTPTITWLEKNLPAQFPGSEFFWFTGSDSVVPRPEFGGKCEIEAKWIAGSKLYRQFYFLVVQRDPYPLAGVNLPDNFRVLPGAVPDISSTKIRDLIEAGKRFEHLVPKAIADYIKRHGLYGYKQ